MDRERSISDSLVRQKASDALTVILSTETLKKE